MGRLTPVVVWMVAIAAAGGCATYGDQLRSALDHAEQGNHGMARQQLEAALRPDGADRLLHRLELGALEHMAGNYMDSNRLLAEAELIGEALFTRRLRDMIGTTLSNPRTSPYPGSPFELAYVHYFRALNYLAMAQESDDRGRRRDLMDSALVEARRLDVRLSELAMLEGEYSDNGGERRRTMARLLGAYRGLHTEGMSREDLVFREGAWLRYLSGVLYEMAGDYDDAFIAYRRAADLYDRGYAAQYGLGEGMVAQAWYDKLRMVRRFDEWEDRHDHLMEAKLAPSQQARLAELRGDEASVIVIEHAGRVPPKREMNLALHADPWRRALVAEPVLSGDTYDVHAQQAWFYLNHADIGPLGLLMHYREGDFFGLIGGLFQKAYYLGPGWDALDGLGLVQPLRHGVRVTVPYPGPHPLLPEGSLLEVAGQRRQATAAEAISQLVAQDMIIGARSELASAVARETFRHAMADAVASRVEEESGGWGALVRIGSQIALFASSAADTRGWHMLPAEIRLARLEVDPGEHRVRLSGEGFSVDEVMRLAPGEVRVLTAHRPGRHLQVPAWRTW
jgi:hypothetical protein